MSGNKFVSYLELRNLEKSCENEISDMKQSIASYCKRAAEIETVISNLILYYNTNGGKDEIKKLRSIDLKTDSFKSLASWASNIEIDYRKSVMKRM